MFYLLSYTYSWGKLLTLAWRGKKMDVLKINGDDDMRKLSLFVIPIQLSVSADDSTVI